MILKASDIPLSCRTVEVAELNEEGAILRTKQVDAHTVYRFDKGEFRTMQALQEGVHAKDCTGEVAQWVESYGTDGEYKGGPFPRCECGLMCFEKPEVEVKPIEDEPIGEVRK
jgi:hypothetical protein